MINEHSEQGTKVRATIIACEPEKRLVHGRLKDGGTISIAVFEIPAAFRWPQVGEVWTIKRENIYWILGDRVNEEVREAFPVKKLSTDPQLRLDATEIFNDQGKELVAFNPQEILEGQVLKYITLSGWVPSFINSVASWENLPRSSGAILTTNPVGEVEWGPIPTISETLRASVPTKLEKGNWQKMTHASQALTISTNGLDFPAFNTIAGSYWAARKFSGAHTVQIRVAAKNTLAFERYIALWLCYNDSNSGYRIKFEDTISTSEIKAIVYLVEEGTETIKLETAAWKAAENDLYSVSLMGPRAASSTLELVILRNPEAIRGWETLGTVGVTKYSEGYVGIEGSGSNPKYADFIAGPITPTAYGTGDSWETGDLKWSTRSSCGLEWLGPCIGQEVSRTIYAALYSIIGTKYGSGNGTTTFNLPNGEERVVMGAGSNYTLGSHAGEAAVILTTSTMPSHNHGGNTGTGSTGTGSTGTGTTGTESVTHTHTAPGQTVKEFGVVAQSGSGAGFTVNQGEEAKTGANSNTHTHSVPALSVPSLSIPALTISSEGGGGAHNNLQPFTTGNLFIHI